MSLSEKEIWDRVCNLKGKTLHTYIENMPNTIVDVQNSGLPGDAVIIKERNTSPIREDIVAAYQFFEENKKLQRSTDLEWLATPEKKTSSIVFRIVGEIAGDNAILISRKPETLKLE